MSSEISSFSYNSNLLNIQQYASFLVAPIFSLIFCKTLKCELVVDQTKQYNKKTISFLLNQFSIIISSKSSNPYSKKQTSVCNGSLFSNLLAIYDSVSTINQKMFFPLFQIYPSSSVIAPTVTVGLICFRHFEKNLIKSQKSSIFLDNTLITSSYLSFISLKISNISSSDMY